MSEFCPLKNYLLKVICVTWVWLTLYQLAWNLTLGSCIYYLSLNGKLPQNLAAENGNHVWSQFLRLKNPRGAYLGGFAPGSFKRLCSRHCLRLWSSHGSTGEGSASTPSYTAIGRPQEIHSQAYSSEPLFSAALWHGSWLPAEGEIQEVVRESIREESQGLLII